MKTVECSACGESLPAFVNYCGRCGKGLKHTRSPEPRFWGIWLKGTNCFLQDWHGMPIYFPSSGVAEAARVANAFYEADAEVREFVNLQPDMLDSQNGNART